MLGLQQVSVGIGGLHGDRKRSLASGGGWKLPAAVTMSQLGNELAKARGIGPLLELRAVSRFPARMTVLEKLSNFCVLDFKESYHLTRWNFVGSVTENLCEQSLGLYVSVVKGVFQSQGEDHMNVSRIYFSLPSGESSTLGCAPR